ncbi:MAG TPA: helix-turn-helix transcriptional regulator [Pseudonocardiaceae bacterium]|jgi:transcriptional regulator with XRE-family HTH domain|nr:helix-turn-helix transcriptional regulator [Pseudonocardiaceae bacterium]
MGNSSVRTREFGARVRILREGIGITGTRLAEDLEVVGSTISRLESGSPHAIGVSGLTVLLTGCGLRGAKLQKYLSGWTAEDNGYFVAPHGDEIPDKLLAIMLHEEAATSLFDYEPIFIPGLLQTEGYIRALFRGAGMSGDGLESAVRLRLERQKPLKRESGAPCCTFYVHENVLRTPVGGKKAMHEQLVKLLIDTGQQSINIRVIPAVTQDVFVPAAFRLMTFDKFGPVGYTSGLGVSAFLEQPGDINRYLTLLNRLDQAALSEAHSRDMLDSLERAYGQP